MLRGFVDLFAAAIQSYMSAIFVCKIFKVREPYKRSILFAFLQNVTSYVLVNYFFTATNLQKIICGDIVFILYGFFLFDGHRIQRVLKSMLEHGMFVIMDIALEILLLPFFMSVLLELPFQQRQLLGRNIATCAVFVLYALLEVHVRRKESRYTRNIAVAAVCLGLIQLIILDLLSRSNPEALVESRLIITALFSMVMIGGYLIVDELFKQIIKQQQKGAELEQMALEKKYQYDYYQKALEQSEKLRDMRHDMRNQLQTVEYLLHSKSEEDRKRAAEMMNMLLEKADYQPHKLKNE